jgi:PHP family Zn ribbon phosphoesterase
VTFRFNCAEGHEPVGYNTAACPVCRTARVLNSLHIDGKCGKCGRNLIVQLHTRFAELVLKIRPTFITGT